MNMVKINEPGVRRTKKKKASGTSFEYRVKVYLQRNGWTMFRSAGSHTCADLIGYKKCSDGKIRNVWIQCKAGIHLVLSSKEKYELVKGMNMYNIIPMGISRSQTFGHQLRYYMYHIELDKFVVVEKPEWI